VVRLGLPSRLARPRIKDRAGIAMLDIKGSSKAVAGVPRINVNPEWQVRISAERACLYAAFMPAPDLSHRAFTIIGPI
jgi:hypothetical protein